MDAAIYVIGMLVVLVLGLQLGLVLAYFFWRSKPTAEAPAKDPTEEELEQARKEREELIRSQEAFQRMMGYNADIAYGINRDDEFTAGGS